MIPFVVARLVKSTWNLRQELVGMPQYTLKLLRMLSDHLYKWTFQMAFILLLKLTFVLVRRKSYRAVAIEKAFFLYERDLN